MATVSIVKTDIGVRAALDKAVALIGGWERFVSPQSRVLIKPNLNGEEGCTNIALAEALLKRLLDLNVKDVFVGEATFGNARMTDMFFRKTGYADLAARYNIPLRNFNKSEPVDVTVERPKIAASIRIAREALDADVIINVPNMKVHYATGATLALKNMKGVLVGDEKKRFHEIGLNDSIVDLNRTLPPQLNIVDCITCMERMGPRGGDPVDLNLIIAGAHAGEVDAVGCRVMGFEPDEVIHVREYLELCGIDPAAIDVAGETIENVRRPFKRVEMERIVPALMRIRERNACSACMNALLLSCRLLESEPAVPIDVSLGSQKEDSAATDGVRVAFGNCCIDEGEFDHVIRGCPPYPFTLGAKLKQHLK